MVWMDTLENFHGAAAGVLGSTGRLIANSSIAFDSAAAAAAFRAASAAEEQ
jgi:hypothetical protein